MKVTANAELTAIEGKSLVFKVKCRDESGNTGEGTHRRAIIDLQRFVQRLERKPGLRAGSRGWDPGMLRMPLRMISAPHDW